MADTRQARPVSMAGPASSPIRGPGALKSGPIRAAVALSVAALLLILAASVTGLLVDGLYQEPGSTSAMLRGYDLVALVVAVPALAGALVGVRRGSPLAVLVWVGLLGYAVYNYAIYVFATGFNDLFLVHVAIFSTSIFALVLALSAVDVSGLARRFRARTPVRLIGGLLAVLGVGLGGIWVYYSLRFAIAGDPPVGSNLVETDTIVHLGYVLDLSLLVPAYLTAAVLLWRRAPWGYLLASVVLVAGTVQQIGYLVAQPFQVDAGIPEAAAFNAADLLVALVFLAATAALLRNLRHLPDPDR